MKRSWFIHMSLGAVVWGACLLCLQDNALAQPGSAGWQAMQAHQAAQQATNHAMQQHWHSQRAQQTARDLQNYSSGQGGGGGWHFQQQAAEVPQVWQPGDRFQSDDLALQYERLSNVDYRSLSPAERGQYKAACRKFRLAVRHGYIYR
jgi:GTPase involved in cell partitioning and DNA repair